MYSRTVNGEVTDFGTSGFLNRSNKLMYDRATNTLWRQFIGEPVVGSLAFSGIQLKMFPVTVTSWELWLAEHPDTTELDIQTGIYTPDRYLPESNPPRSTIFIVKMQAPCSPFHWKTTSWPPRRRYWACC